MALSLSAPTTIVSAGTGTSIVNDDGGLWVFWEGLVGCVLAGFILHRAFCHNTTSSTIASTHALRKAQILAKRELLLLQEASMDVSAVYLFPAALSPLPDLDLDLWQFVLRLLRTGSGILHALLLGMPTKPNAKDEDENLRHNGCLVQLLHRVWAPLSTDTNTKNHRIHVLGRALWFRFHVHAKPFTQDSLKELLESQPETNFIATKKKDEFQHTAIELPFMKGTILWAVLPQDRPIISHCLDELAWATSESVPCWPAEVLTLMLDCIIKTYDIVGKGELQLQPQNPNQSQLEGSQLLQSPADGGSDLDDHHSKSWNETQRLVKSNEDAEKDLRLEEMWANQAKRLLGYLHLLGVLMPCDDDYLDSADNNIKGENDFSRPRLYSCCKLRPGVLKERQTPHLKKGSDAWTKRFTTRLLENAGNNFCNTGILSSFYFHNLPSLFLRLGCYSQCSHLLHCNEAFATARLQYLGLEKTVDAYVSEWEGLHHGMQSALLSAPERKNPIASPVVAWLCTQTVSIAVQELTLPSTCVVPINLQERIKVRQGLATTCYCFGFFVMNLSTAPYSSSDEKEQRSYNTHFDAFELLHKGRHLQLLVLEAFCRCGAKSIENLGITLHVRETVPKKNKKPVATTGSILDHSLLLKPKQYFDLSQKLLDAIKHLCRDHKEEIDFTETTLDELATSLCQALVRTASELMPLPQRNPNTQPTGVGSNDNVSLGPCGWEDGMEFRIQQVLDFFHQGKDASQRFAKFQNAICTLPCNAAQVEATTDFLRVLSQLEGLIL